MDFESKLSDLKIGGKKSNKQKSEKENITNLYNAREEVINFYKDYSGMMHNARYDATPRKGFKILTTKQMLQRLPIALAK